MNEVGINCQGRVAQECARLFDSTRPGRAVHYGSGSRSLKRLLITERRARTGRSLGDEQQLNHVLHSNIILIV